MIFIILFILHERHFSHFTIQHDNNKDINSHTNNYGKHKYRHQLSFIAANQGTFIFMRHKDLIN